jgi:hypothetical protein
MKSILSFLLIISVSLLSVSKSLICFSYQLNKDFISTHLCENRNKPQMHCNGKCHIIKKLKEDSKQDNSPVNIKSNLEVQLYSEKMPGYNLAAFYSGQFFFSHFAGSGLHLIFSVFHPPQL